MEDPTIAFIHKFKKQCKLIERVDLPIVQSDKFYLPLNYKNVTTPYSSIYFNRYNQIIPRLATITTPNFIDKIQLIQKQQGVISTKGTIFKEMKLKQYYFNQLSHIGNCTSNDDYCYLEDTSGRVKLRISQCKLVINNELERDITVNSLVTGLVVIVEGHIIENNVIQVNKIYLPTLPKQRIPQELHVDVYLCLISGINYKANGNQLPIEKFVNLMQGNLYQGELYEIAQRISQIVIAGNLYSNLDSSECLTGAFKQKEDIKQLFHETQANIEGLDGILSKLSNITPVCIMPGANEPVSAMLPQNQLHKAHFPQVFEGGQVQLMTNPVEFSMGGLHVIGTSGQNIIDLLKYSKLSEQEAIEMTQLWGHIAPTLPDTLPGYPTMLDDPFVMNEIPHIYFVGNMSEYTHRTLQLKSGQNILMIGIPQLSESGQICVVNLRNLECSVISLD